MSRNFYSEINLHAVWHTKNSAPLLTPEFESSLHRFIRGKILQTPGVFFHEIGGTETHVHAAFSIVPTITISTLIGQLKGASSHEINVIFGRGAKLLEWQEGYCVVSFGTRQLEWIRDYVRDQKRHHKTSTTHERLERTEFDDERR
jgi:putative transposase